MDSMNEVVNAFNIAFGSPKVKELSKHHDVILRSLPELKGAELKRAERALEVIRAKINAEILRK